ncbi:MAG: hypothetical protein WA749_14775 [Gelidibacter sp.]
MNNSNRHINRYILIIGFLFLLNLPNLVMLSSLENTQSNENKKNTKSPDFNLNNPKRLVSEYKNYYEDNFGLRTTLINIYLSFKVKILKENPLPNHVVKGQDGWYFLGNDHNDILNDTFGNVPFTKAQLNAITQNLESTNTYLQSKNIKFYIVVPPNKQTIYQEKLPYHFGPHTKRLEQLQNHLEIKNSLHIVSLEPRLFSEKKHQRLYHKTDTHWNDYGAYWGYAETLEVIKKDFDITPIQLSEYSMEATPINGDITAMINENIPENGIALQKIKPSQIDTISPIYTFQHYKNRTKNLKLLMHSDSFSNAWIPFFNESFGETVYIRTYELNHALIEKIQPDIVIFEIVERNLLTLINIKKSR